MAARRIRIGLCAPSAPFFHEDVARIVAIANEYGDAITLEWHPQCFDSAGHFAGEDATRLAAFVDLANRDDLDAVWFARGGYGAVRIAADAIPMLTDAARRKTYLGYSDSGNLLAALYAAGIGRPVHAPLAADIRRDGGDVTIQRLFNWLLHADQAALEPDITPNVPHVAFNLMTLSMMIGTPIMSNLAGHVLIIEEVSEYMYAFDRAVAHVLTALADTGLAGLRLGRVSDIPENDRPFGATAEECVRYWCAKNGIAFLGAADIGHDIDNKIVPFGIFQPT